MEQNKTNEMLRKGTVLHGNYRIEDHLASGGFGNTYLATHTELGETFAIKEFYMKGVSERGEDSTTVKVSNTLNRNQFESQRSKFKKEALRLRKLHDKHIVSVYDLFDENGTSYYVMDFIDGMSLSSHLKQTGKPMQEEQVWEILPQILQALETVHTNGFQHLDLKPANIMMDGKGNITLIDFGASKQLDRADGNSTSSALAYTPGYAPREQMEQNLSKLGPWTDLYALGATLYNLVTCEESPLPSDIDDEHEQAFSFPEHISEKMKRLILWMMTPKRDKRPQSVQQLRERLEKGLPEETAAKADIISEETIVNPPTPSPAPDPKPTPTPSPKLETNKKGLLSRLKYAMLALVAVGCIVASLYVWRSCESDTDNFPGMESTVPQQPSEPEYEVITANGVSFKMIRVEGGTFQMGATSEQGSDAYDDEKPAHSVTLSSYYIGETEVTQELWQAVMGSNPSSFKGTNRPVEQVSWDDCQTFISKLDSITGKNFRLPTEAEWEYAARGGNKSRGYKYSGSNSVGDVAWYTDNSGSETHPVKSKSPNELGIYDMSGNVWEWCQDWYGSYESSSQTNPTGPSSGSSRVIRGGGWSNHARGCRVSFRSYSTPDFRSSYLGLRLVL